jgi:hypothetical protein
VAKFFMIQSRDSTKEFSYKDADRLAAKMAERIPDRRVRLLAVRKRGRHGFVYGLGGHHAVDPAAIVARLRAHAEFGHIAISRAANAPDGPFDWR